MSLQERLDEYRKAFRARTSPEVLETMRQALNKIRESVNMGDVIKAGTRAPEFELPNTKGEIIKSAALLQRGPLVVSFFRGAW
jgi:hypothetical protein